MFQKMKRKELTFFFPEMEKTLELPLFLASVKAGFPSPADDFLEKKLDLNEYLIEHPAATFFVRVDGDSMQGAKIYKDDILIVDRSLKPTNKKIIIALINGEFTVKRIRIRDNEIFLEAENPDFPLIHIDPEWDFQVWGVVTYIIHKAK